MEAPFLLIHAHHWCILSNPSLASFQLRTSCRHCQRRGSCCQIPDELFKAAPFVCPNCPFVPSIDDSIPFLCRPLLRVFSTVSTAPFYAVLTSEVATVLPWLTTISRRALPICRISPSLQPPFSLAHLSMPYPLSYSSSALLSLACQR